MRVASVPGGAEVRAVGSRRVPVYSADWITMTARILVAEDDLKQADLIRIYLEREGHSVMVVHDGRTALDRIRRSPPDLVVLDLMMPRMDGLDVTRVLRA